MKSFFISTAFFGLLIVGLSSAQIANAQGALQFEVGLNYRSSTIDKDNYQTTTSYLGSVAYYFGSQSALELSYTNGQSKLSAKAGENEDTFIFTTNFRFIGLDFVLSFAGREDRFQPYIKMGGGHISKEIFRTTDAEGTEKFASLSGIAPSAGLGFKILLSQGFSLKAGVDAWTAPINEESKDNPAIDYSGRLGLVFSM